MNREPEPWEAEIIARAYEQDRQRTLELLAGVLGDGKTYRGDSDTVGTSDPFQIVAARTWFL